jgi:hypothetical protein
MAEPIFLLFLFNILFIMTFTTLIYSEHQIIKMVHTVISMTFLIGAIWLFYRAVKGYFRHLTYTCLDKILSYIFIVNLYLQLIFGFILMVSPAVIKAPDTVVQDTVKLAAKRFWPVEHIVLMLFALFIANLGLIFSNSTEVDREKHRKVIIYYAIALVLIALSLGSTYLE